MPYNKTNKRCYVCDLKVQGHKPERVNVFADADEHNNELCEVCYIDACNDHVAEQDHYHANGDARDEEYMKHGIG